MSISRSLDHVNSSLRLRDYPADIKKKRERRFYADHERDFSLRKLQFFSRSDLSVSPDEPQISTLSLLSLSGKKKLALSDGQFIAGVERGKKGKDKK